MANQAQYDNALKNSGGDVNSPMFKRWLATYGGVAPTAGTTTGGTPAPGVPTPTQGQGAYGLVPGVTTTVDPTELYKHVYPTLTADLGQAQSNIGSQLRGEIPDDVASNVWDKRAAQAAAGGTAGSPFTFANTARDLGLTRMQIQQQGQENLGNMLSTTYPTVTAPGVELSQNNAQLASAPDPQTAALTQQSIFSQQQDKSFSQQQQQLQSYLSKYLPQPATANGWGKPVIPFGMSYAGGLSGNPG